MNDEEIFRILRTCIIGEAYEACGIGFNPEDNLDIYHLEDLIENIDPDDFKGLYSSPDSFLEMECNSVAGRIYETIRLMETSWFLGYQCFHKNWHKPIGGKLWDLGKEKTMEYLSVYGEKDDISFFVNRGDALFGCTL